jgi:3-isopropylmalate/(R)-2-methylmalate dehydratase small subunit
MEKFTRIATKACPLQAANIDTDQILPARFLKLPRKGQHGKVLLCDLRFDAEGNERPEFPLNRPHWREAKIIVAARNFGGGSSREAAVYALLDFGIRCVIAPSFGDIFAQNATKNGLLPAVLGEAETNALMLTLERDPASIITVDLRSQSIASGELQFQFAVDPSRRDRLLNGWDDFDVTNSFRKEIADFRSLDQRRRPWATPGETSASR